jgi:hypothetical protein
MAALIFNGLIIAFSQSVTETRIIKTTAIEIYEQYVSVMNKLYNGNVYNPDNFLSLFDEKATLYNDILPHNRMQQLSPQQYFDIFTQNIRMIYCKYDKLELKFPVRERDKWQIVCEFSREVRFKTKPGFYYPRYRFDYTVTLAMDTVYDDKNKVFANAKIQQIDVKKPLIDFFIIENADNYTLKYKGKNLDDWDAEYNSCMFSAREVDINQITVAGSSYFNTLKFTQNQENNHFFDFRKAKKNLFGFGLNYSPGKSRNTLNPINFPNIKQTNRALSMEFFFGLQLATRGESTWFFNLKLGLNAYQNTFKGDYSTQYNAIDADNDPYLRKIRINSLEETVNNYSISLPLSIEYLVRISQNVMQPIFLSFEAGGYAEYRRWANNKFHFSASYTGLYDYYGGVEFDHYYDYGYFDLSDREIFQSLTSQINPFDYGAFGSVGLWFAVNKSNLLKFNVMYKHGFQPPLKYRNDFVLSENYNHYKSLLQGVNRGLRNVFVGFSWVSTIN